MCDSLLRNSLPFPPFKYLFREGGGRLEVNRWIGTHFHDCIDFMALHFQLFSIELLEWGYTFLRF